MSMMRNFDKEFVERTIDLLSGNIQEKALEYDVTLQLNCLLAMITLPLERKRHENSVRDDAFKKSCVDYLKKNAVIAEGTEKDDKYIVMDIRDAIAHLRIKVDPNPYGKIETVVLTNDYNPNYPFECSMTVSVLKGFALHVATEYLKHYF